MDGSCGGVESLMLWTIPTAHRNGFWRLACFLVYSLASAVYSLALCAIAITFWLAEFVRVFSPAALAAVLRFYFFEGGQPALSRLIYDLVFVVFAVLMTEATRARDELEVRVAERTADLTDANESLNDEIAERRRTEQKLQQSEAYLAEAQKVSHAGSFGWRIVSGKIFWSDETFRIFELAPATQPTLELIFERIHPEDRHSFESSYRPQRKTGSISILNIDC